MMGRGEAIGMVEGWLEELDIIVRRLDRPAPGVVVVYEVTTSTKQDPGKYLLNVAFPVKILGVLITGQTIISPEHEAKWVNATSEMQGQFLHDYWETCARGKLVPSLKMSLKPPHLWGVTSEIYFDGLTQDRFFRRLRGVAATTHYLVYHFLKIIGMMPSPNDPTGGVLAPAGNKLDVEWDDKPKEGTT